MTGFISIDAESNGLGGRAFAVALTLNDGDTEVDSAVFRCPIREDVDEWVADNVLPALTDLPEDLRGYSELLGEAYLTIKTWGGKATPLIAHVAWPVEARLLLDVYDDGDHIWEGPYPLIDVASVLLARGYDPLTVDAYLADHGIAAPDGSPHHPLYDARAAARCYAHLMAASP